MGPQLLWSSIACFYYRILRFMPGPSVGPNINLNDFMTVMDYSIFFLDEEYFFDWTVLDMDQKAKLYIKVSFFGPVQSYIPQVL